MVKKVRRSNVKDGVLLPLGNGFSLVKGDYPNKVDDVDIGPNNKTGLSVNHGEILQQKGNTLRVFSAEPMLGGVSPVQLLYGGMAPDKVFAMQETFKDIHGINDDGSKYVMGGNKENIPNVTYNKLSKKWKSVVNTVASKIGVSENEIEQYFNEGRLNPAIAAYYNVNGRVRENDSPTKEASEKRGDNINKTIYGNVLSNGQITQSGKPNLKYAIPYLEDKEIIVDGVGRVTTNALDSLAKYAKISKISLQEAFGLYGQETKGGAIPYGNVENIKKSDSDEKQKETKERNRALFNLNYAREYGWTPAEYTVRDFEYNRLGHEVDRSVPPLQHAFDYFKKGKYNTGDPNHTKDVLNKGSQMLNDSDVKKWISESEYAKDVKVKKQFGGRKRFQFGGDDEDKYNTLLNAYNIAVQNRKTAIKLSKDADKAFYNYQDSLPDYIRLNKNYNWKNIPKLRELHKKREIADNELSKSTNEYFDNEQKIAEATINKYKNTNADLLKYDKWSNTEQGAINYLLKSGVRESIGAQEVADYFNSYANSIGFQRIINNQAAWGQKRHPYRRYYDPAYTKNGFTTSAKRFKKALLENPMTSFGVFDINSYPGMGFNYTKFSPYNHIIINSAGNPFLNQQEEKFPYWYELTHEMLHDYNFIGTGQGEALDQNINTEPGHDSQNDEKHSDLEALRFMLYKYNIYDSRKDKDAKAEDIKKLRDMFPKLRPLEQMDDETAAWMINHVASIDKIDKEDKRNKAQFGGQTNINSLGERPNAKYGKEMSNPVKKANKYYERKLKEENPKMSFPERLQKDYEQLMSPPSLRNIKRRPYKKYKLDEPKIQIDSTKNNSENKRNKAVNGRQQFSISGLPAFDFTPQNTFGDYSLNKPFYPTYVDGPLIGLRVPQKTLNTPAFPTNFTPKSTVGQIDPFMGTKPTFGTSATGTQKTNPVEGLTKGSGLSTTAMSAIGAGINTLGSLIGAGIQQGAINSLEAPQRQYTLLNPVKLKTKININPQIARMREMQAQIADAARRTSGSSRTAYQKMLAGHNRLLDSAMDLYGRKENVETELINRDKLNQQQIAHTNATNVMNTVNYNNEAATEMRNRKRVATSNNWTTALNTIAGAWAGPNGFIDRANALRVKAGELYTQAIANPTAARLLYGDIDFTTGANKRKAFNTIYDLLNNNRFA